jgi:hypothetical protein
VHVTVRKYADKAALIGGLVPPVRDGFVPLLRRAPGFKGYCAFASEDGHAVSLTVFDGRRSAMRADDLVREWVVSSLRDLLPNPPEVLAGEALLHEVPWLRSGGPDLYVTILSYDGMGPKEAVLPLVREHVFPVVTGAPGFRAVYVFGDEQEPSRAATVALLDTRADALRSHERSLRALREEAGDVARPRRGWRRDG